MVSIYEARKVEAPLDRIWDIISDLDRDLEYWKGLTSIRNTRKEGNLVEREVIVGFMGRKGTQRIVLHPKESVEMTLMSGPLRGSRTVSLSPLRTGCTMIEVEWKIEFSEIPAFAQGFVRSRLEQTTREALEKIASAAERTT